MNIKLKGTDKLKVNSAGEIYPIMQRILMRESKIDRNREHFWTISLDTANQILNIELVSMGTINRTLVEPMEVLSIPLQKRAVKLVLIHNHPSGQLNPSEADKDMTDLLIQACRIMQIDIVDHLIISETAYYSFQESGLLKTLEQSVKYVMPYELKERYQKAGIEHGLKKGKQEQLREVARTMKREGYDIDAIAKITGLSKATISKLKAE